VIYFNFNYLVLGVTNAVEDLEEKPECIYEASDFYSMFEAVLFSEFRDVNPNVNSGNTRILLIA
jgi:hypothetical protein